jgi:serine/threonine-protein kinase
MGSPMYMSPEQVRSAKHVDGRTDIWALGAILFELVAGRAPFWAESVPDIFVKILERPAPRLDEALRDPPAGLAETIARCLEKDRDKRFQTVDALAAALANLGVKPTSPTVPPWDRAVDIPIDENGDGTVPFAAVSAPLVLGPTTPARPRAVAAETFVLPGRSRSRGKTIAWVFVSLAICGLALGAAARYRHKISALVASRSTAEAAPVSPVSPVSPGPAAEPAGANGAVSTVAASTSKPGAQTAEPVASVAQPARVAGSPTGRPRAGTRAGSKQTSLSPLANAPVAPTSELPAASPEPVAPAAPAPSLRRTDW